MTDNQIDLNGFIIALCEAPKRWINQATDGLTEDQLHYRPTPDSNSIAWLIWHLSRWRDRISATVSGEVEVWISDGWDRRFNMESGRTGLGDTTEQVAGFRVDRDLLMGYANAAHDALVQRVSKLTPEQFEQSTEYRPGVERPAWSALVSVMEDSAEHTGQINYLRGMITGPGWR